MNEEENKWQIREPVLRSVKAANIEMHLSGVSCDRLYAVAQNDHDKFIDIRLELPMDMA